MALRRGCFAKGLGARDDESDNTWRVSARRIKTQVTDAGLAHFQDCKELTNLWLEQMRVSDVGLAYFADCPKLVSVHVKKTDVTEAGVKKLAAALPQCKIEWDETQDKR